MSYILINDSGRRIGETHPKAKYSEAVVSGIWYLSSIGESRQSIADAIGIPYSTVRSILSGRTRCQFADPVKTRKR